MDKIAYACKAGCLRIGCWKVLFFTVKFCIPWFKTVQNANLKSYRSKDVTPAMYSRRKYNNLISRWSSCKFLKKRKTWSFAAFLFWRESTKCTKICARTQHCSAHEEFSLVMLSLSLKSFIDKPKTLRSPEHIHDFNWENYKWIRTIPRSLHRLCTCICSI